jgi:hypothetical protein
LFVGHYLCQKEEEKILNYGRFYEVLKTSNMIQSLSKVLGG